MLAARPISACGYNCFACITLIQILFCSFCVTGPFWLVAFWDCPAYNNYYFLSLSRGLCYDNDSSGSDDVVSCEEWTHLRNGETETKEEAAEAYYNAYGIAISALTFSILLCLFIFIAKCYGNDTSDNFRYAVIALAAFIAVLLFSILASITSTYYTDPNHYTYIDICSNYGSIPSSGWGSCSVAFLLSCSLAAAIFSPCCQCRGHEHEATQAARNNPTTSTLHDTAGVSQESVVEQVNVVVNEESANEESSPPGTTEPEGNQA